MGSNSRSGRNPYFLITNIFFFLFFFWNTLPGVIRNDQAHGWILPCKMAASRMPHGPCMDPVRHEVAVAMPVLRQGRHGMACILSHISAHDVRTFAAGSSLPCRSRTYGACPVAVGPGGFWRPGSGKKEACRKPISIVI